MNPLMQAGKNFGNMFNGLGNIGNIINMFKNGGNPETMMQNLISQNPQFQNFLKTNGINAQNAEQVFYAECQKIGVNPQTILSQINR